MSLYRGRGLLSHTPKTMLRKPKLGQNFLIDENARQSIVDALGDASARTVIEIGPGHGAITELLALRCRRLIAIELDPSLAAELRFHFRAQPHVEVLEADVLDVDLATLVVPGESADVVGNLPYYITSPILLRLFAAGRSGHLARVERLFTLPPAAFNPPPDVHSTVLRLEFAPRFEELGVEPAAFEVFLRTCFAQKRKTLANNLRAHSRNGVASYTPEQIRAAWPAEIPPQARAESLALEPLAALHRALSCEKIPV